MQQGFGLKKHQAMMINHDSQIKNNSMMPSIMIIYPNPRIRVEARPISRYNSNKSRTLDQRSRLPQVVHQ